MLPLKKQGVPNRKIAVSIGMNKETVNNYMKKFSADTLSVDELLKPEAPEQEYRLKGGAVASKNHVHNQKRMQQHPYTREEHFLAIEKSNLLPLPQTDFEIRYYTNLKVAQKCFIFLGRDKHYYSVSYQYIGQEAHVIYTRTLVKVFIDGKPDCTHMRDRRPGLNILYYSTPTFFL